MKKLISIGLITASLVATSYAAPFMAVGDGAELFITGTLGVRFDDNIYLGDNETDDLIFDINPGVELTFGKDAQLKGALTLVDQFANYSDNSDLNTQLFQADFVTRYDDGKMKLGFNAGYHELNQNTYATRGLVRRDVFNTGANGEVEVSQLTAVGAGVAFTHENYKRRGYTDSDLLVVPVDFYYKWTPKTDLSVGYQYRDTAVDIGSDSTDHYFNVGARGEFSPKLTGRFTVGYGQRDMDRGGDESLLGLQGSFTYEISPKTNLQVGISNDFGTSPQGVQEKNFVLNGLVSTKISSEWSLVGGLSYRQIEYYNTTRNRTDDYWEGYIGTEYIVNANIRILASYTYRDYASDLRGADFKNNVFNVAAAFRY